MQIPGFQEFCMRKNMVNALKENLSENNFLNEYLKT